MKIRVQNSLFMGVVLFSLIFLLGCGTLETLVNKEGTATSFGDFIGGDKNATLPAASITSPSADSKEVSLYFADATGKYLVEEQRRLPKTLSLARETVIEWLKGPAASTGTSVQAAVPTSTTLLDIAIKENVVIVDLSKEFLQPNSKVSPEVALYGLVNTLTQFSTIKQVQIRVEGKPLTKYGTIDATNLLNKGSLVKGAASINPNSNSNPNSKSNPKSNPIVPTSGSGVSTQDKTSNGALPDSPSSINLFNYPPSTT